MDVRKTVPPHVQERVGVVAAEKELCVLCVLCMFGRWYINSCSDCVCYCVQAKLIINPRRTTHTHNIPARSNFSPVCISHRRCCTNRAPHFSMRNAYLLRPPFGSKRLSRRGANTFAKLCPLIHSPYAHATKMRPVTRRPPVYSSRAKF